MSVIAVRLVEWILERLTAEQQHYGKVEIEKMWRVLQGYPLSKYYVEV